MNKYPNAEEFLTKFGSYQICLNHFPLKVIKRDSFETCRNYRWAKNEFSLSISHINLNTYVSAVSLLFPRWSWTRSHSTSFVLEMKMCWLFYIDCVGRWLRNWLATGGLQACTHALHDISLDEWDLLDVSQITMYCTFFGINLHSETALYVCVARTSKSCMMSIGKVTISCFFYKGWAIVIISISSATVLAVVLGLLRLFCGFRSCVIAFAFSFFQILCFLFSVDVLLCFDFSMRFRYAFLRHDSETIISILAFYRKILMVWTSLLCVFMYVCPPVQ